MCGRATLRASPEEIAEAFDVDPVPVGPPRFNISPGQPVATVRVPRQGRRELALLRWGLVPWWTKEEEAKRMASRCIQARAETLATAPAYRDAFRDRRCIVVVDGFYEWSAAGPNATRVPHHVTTPEKKLFGIAAVWESWRTKDGEVVETAAVVTTPAKGAVAGIHDRMPLVLAKEDYEAWLSGPSNDAQRIVRDGGCTELSVVPVSTWVNDVRHDDARCIEPAAEAPPLGQIALRFD
jgi:putative SOS response-associated peptidase YedK